MGGQGDQAPFYSCETLSIEMAFESQNYSRMRARAMAGKYGLSLAAPRKSQNTVGETRQNRGIILSIFSFNFH